MSVSVIIPTYNRADTINRALESVFQQTTQVDEVIVVDDGSTDDTENVISARWGDRVKYYRQENQGACVARNTGASMAKGEFFAFLDSDDEWLPEKIEKQLELAKTTDDEKLGAVLCARRKITPDGRVENDLSFPALNGDSFELLINSGWLMGASTSSFFVHRKVFEASITFDPEQPALQDWDFLTTLSRKFTIATIPELLVIHHREDGGAHIHEGNRVIQARLRILEKYADDLRERPAALAAHHRSLASAYFRSGDLKSMKDHLKAAQTAKSRADITLWIILAQLNPALFSAGLKARRVANRMLAKLNVKPLPRPFV